MDVLRRQILFATVAGAAIAATGFAVAKNPAGGATAIKGDDGQQIEGKPVPSGLVLADLPGLVWAGSSHPDVTIYEFYDYNCGFCKRAASELDQLIKDDPNLRLGLVNHVIYGVASVQAAKVQQAVLKLHGAERAYEFHRALFAHHGPVDGQTALDTVTDMKLDAAAIETTADSDQTATGLIAQAKAIKRLGFEATPSFVLQSTALQGYPGARAMHQMVASLRSCGKLAC